jgi:hypothetical protein
MDACRNRTGRVRDIMVVSLDSRGARPLEAANLVLIVSVELAVKLCCSHGSNHGTPRL